MEGLDQTLWERVRTTGVKTAALRDLLALVLTREVADIPLNLKEADKLLRLYEAKRVHEISQADMQNASGIEGFEAFRLLAAIEIGRRAAASGKGEIRSIEGDEDAYELFKPVMQNADQELFMAACLNAKGGVITTSLIHQGTLTGTIVGSREVFREALKHNAASVIVAHNHPSGDPEPSPEDIQMTRVLKKAGEVLDVPLLDHIIVGRDRFVSLARRGYL